MPRKRPRQIGPNINRREDAVSQHRPQVNPHEEPATEFRNAFNEFSARPPIYAADYERLVILSNARMYGDFNHLVKFNPLMAKEIVAQIEGWVKLGRNRNRIEEGSTLDNKLDSLLRNLKGKLETERGE